MCGLAGVTHNDFFPVICVKIRVIRNTWIFSDLLSVQIHLTFLIDIAGQD